MARRTTKTRAHASRAAASVEEINTRAGKSVERIADAIESTSERVGSTMQERMTAGSRQFAVLGEQAFEAWLRNSNDTVQRILALNAELASWGREQLDESLGAVRSLAQCRSIGDAYGIQLGLVRASMENNVRHASRVLSLARHLTAAGAQAVRQPQAQD
jgi:hypothetical protein